VVRRTDSNNSAVLNPQTVLPDLARLTLTAWQSPTPSVNPYNGSPTPHLNAHLFRLDLYFFGLVNPPGRMGDGTVIPYEPFKYGTNPVYGFVELDMDRDRNTGGELSSAARTRYLANIARFGRLPSNSSYERAAFWGTDLQYPFGQNPSGPEHEFRRSGADFLLNLCGCYELTVESEGGNGNQIFDPGETWIVRSAFFIRSGGYREASFCFGGLSGVRGCTTRPSISAFRTTPPQTRRASRWCTPLTRLARASWRDRPRSRSTTTSPTRPQSVRRCRMSSTL
jgi:hypothetical protein